MPQHIVVTKHRPEWAGMYREEAEAIKKILKDNCIAIHHIGSTSVPGLAAKPIIDIMPVVKDLDAVDAVAGEFEQLGYEYLGEFGIAGRRYLRKGGDERTHQIHIFQMENTADIDRHLAVRDFLRVHPETAEEYGKLKQQLAERFPYDIRGYCDGKDGFMKRLEQTALQWQQEQPDEIVGELKK